MRRIGKKIEGMQYRKRIGSYAIIEHKEDSKVAIANVEEDYFFFGGGVEEGETEIDALKREMLEETGYDIKNIQYFDKVTSWADCGNRGLLDITATFYIAEFDKKVVEPIEKDHKILWVDAMEYKDKLLTEYQRYILEKYTQLKKNIF